MNQEYELPADATAFLEWQPSYEIAAICILCGESHPIANVAVTADDYICPECKALWLELKQRYSSPQQP